MKTDTTAVVDGLRRVVKALREGSLNAEMSGVSSAQLFVLHALAEEGGLSLNALAERTHTHQSSVSVVVSRLVEKKLVKRGQAKDDARRLVLQLTAQGKRRLQHAPDPTPASLIEAIDALSATERKTLAKTLGKIGAHMALPADPPDMFFEEPEQRR